MGEIIGRLLDPATSTVMLRRGSCPETWTAGDAPLYSNEVEPCCQLVKRHVPPFHLYLTEDKESDVEFLGFGNQSPQEMLITKHGDGGVSGKQVRAGALFFLVLLSPQAPSLVPALREASFWFPRSRFSSHFRSLCMDLCKNTVFRFIGLWDTQSCG